MTQHEHGAEATHVCPICQQVVERAKVDVIDVAAAVAADQLTESDVFKRTYLGHGTQSSVFAGITQTSPTFTGRVTPPTVTEPVPAST
jgi:hypothetical protein